MDAASRGELLAACRVIFDRSLNASFLEQLQESGLKSAWRRKALQTHPDRTPGRAAKHRHTQHFIEARRAYGLLREYLARGAASAPAPQPAHQPRQQRPAAHRREQPNPSTPLPRRRMRIGEYLYFSRVIRFSTLIEAILWQRRQRDRFCDVGRRWGYLSEAAVETLFSGRRPHERVGAAAERLRLLTAFQVRTLLHFQQSRQEPLGNYFVRRGLLSTAALERLLHRLADHNAAFP